MFSLTGYIIVIILVCIFFIARKKTRQETVEFWRKMKLWEKIIWILLSLFGLMSIPIISDALDKSGSFLAEISFGILIMCIVISMRMSSRIKKKK